VCTEHPLEQVFYDQYRSKTRFNIDLKTYAPDIAGCLKKQEADHLKSTKKASIFTSDDVRPLAQHSISARQPIAESSPAPGSDLPIWGPICFQKVGPCRSEEKSPDYHPVSRSFYGNFQ
jgi:hypothetical protein